MKHSPFYKTTEPSYKLHKTNSPNHNDMERYGIIGDTFGKAVGLTESTVKTLAKATADNLVIPVGKYVATKIVVPVSEHVAKEIVLPVGKYVAKEIALPVGKYVAAEIVSPLAKEILAETKDMRAEIMKYFTEQIREIVKQETKDMPNKIIEGIKGKLPFGAPGMEDDYETYNSEAYMHWQL